MPVELSWQPGRDVLFCVQVARRKHPLCGYKGRNREICRVGKGQGAGVGWHPVQSLGRWYSMASAPPPTGIAKAMSASLLSICVDAQHQHLLGWQMQCAMRCSAAQSVSVLGTNGALLAGVVGSVLCCGINSG